MKIRKDAHFGLQGFEPEKGDVIKLNKDESSIGAVYIMKTIKIKVRNKKSKIQRVFENQRFHS